MSEFTYESMDSMQYDVLKEIGNIGAGNATTALSQMVNAKIDMRVPDVQLYGFKELAEIVGGAENLVIGILFTLEGQLDGMMLFMMDQDSAHHILNLIMGRDPNGIRGFSEMDLSALCEVGNIIAGAYLSSISTLTNMYVGSSVPYLAMDMAGAILSVPAIEFGKVGDKALVVKTEFAEDDVQINGYFVMIPTLESYGKMMSSLGL